MSEENEQKTLTRAAHERLRAELEELQTAGRKDIAERLQRARELGDLSENAEYHETKNAQGMMEARIRTIEHILRTTVVVDTPTATDKAVAGTFVTLRPVGSSDDEVYLLASSKEERASGALTVTTSSPLGSAINGKGIGETVEYEAPGGVFSYEIVKIEPWDGVS
ncbi:MAG TPA: transcription elongation factor GreA [Actinomycetota bacterium]|nr:transcription elongation factor GreA [Actinomycetota bacterium]